MKMNCSEQAFMILKALTFGDRETGGKILKARHPAEQKALGKLVKGYKDEVWSHIRYELMLDVVYEKFRQNPTLASQMLNTGDRMFVEASPTDTIWGIGLAETDDRILDKANWRGQNLLGDVLCQVRDRLRMDKKHEIQ